MDSGCEEIVWFGKHSNFKSPKAERTHNLRETIYQRLVDKIEGSSNEICGFVFDDLIRGASFRELANDANGMDEWDRERERMRLAIPGNEMGWTEYVSLNSQISGNFHRWFIFVSTNISILHQFRPNCAQNRCELSATWLRWFTSWQPSPQYENHKTN